MRYQGLNLEDEHCILCGNIARYWSGHYHYGNKTIIAGWCDDHRKYCAEENFLPVRNCEGEGLGCFGREGELPLLLEEKMLEDHKKEILKKAGY